MGPGRKPRRPVFSQRGSNGIVEHGLRASILYTWYFEYASQSQKTIPVSFPYLDRHKLAFRLLKFHFQRTGPLKVIKTWIIVFSRFVNFISSI